jgi:thymidylate kinase
MLITLEGLPYSGKKTQQQFLAEQLKKWNFGPVATTSEPGWNKETSGILKYLATQGPASPEEKLFLFLADRAGHFSRFIRPIYDTAKNLYKGDNPAIVCVGGPDSTVAHQGFGDDVAPVSFIAKANDIAMKNIKITATFVIDITPEEVRERMPHNERVKVNENTMRYLHRIREGYRRIEEVEDRVHIIDGMKDEEEVFKEILRVLTEVLAPK